MSDDDADEFMAKLWDLYMEGRVSEAEPSAEPSAEQSALAFQCALVSGTSIDLS